MYIYEATNRIYHLNNLTKVLNIFHEILNKNNERSQQELTLIRKIKNLENQLNYHKINKRSINFLGKLIKYAYGNPDHDDLVAIETSLNDIINNNNKQRVINSQFDKIIRDMNPQNMKEQVLLTEIYEELLNIVRTINAAKVNEFLSETLNIEDIHKIISQEHEDIPIINILEYSNITLVKTKDYLVTVYKYPIIKEKCENYKITPISFRHGKIIIDKMIAKCNESFIRINNCMNYLNSYICKINKDTDNNCTLAMLNNNPANCKVSQEYDQPIVRIESNIILLNNDHILNNTIITGKNLITFEDSINIDGKTYTNINNEIKNILMNKHNETLIIDEIVNSNSMYSFDNIDSLRKYTIPFEEEPVWSTFKLFFIIFMFFALSILSIKFIKLILKWKKLKNDENFQKLYDLELQKLKCKI